jgi:cytochrome c oxidase subunit 3
MRKTQKHTHSAELNNGGGMLMPTNRLFVYVAIGIITMLFVGLSGSYLYHGMQLGFQQFSMPAVFHSNTIIILLSSVTFQFAVRAMWRNEEKIFLSGIILTFLLGCCFIIFQLMGWNELSERGIKINTMPAGSYLYMISGLHALHFLAGIILLGIVLIQAIIRHYDPIKELLFSTDNIKKQNVGLVALYWHFVDALWVAIYVMFSLSMWL